MTIETLKALLPQLSELRFQLPNGNVVPPSVHLTELGIIDKNFIDCGGTSRKETKASLQLWEGNDTEHRLSPEKLLNIVNMVEKQLPIHTLSIEVEYQTDTVGLFGLDFKDGHFLLTSKQTQCLAGSACGSGTPKKKVSLRNLKTTNCC